MTRTTVLASIVAGALLAAAAQGDDPWKVIEVKKDSYRVGVKFKVAPKVGWKESARVWVVPAQGWKVNGKFPFKIDVTVPAGVSAGKASYGKGDAVEQGEKKAVWKLSYKATAAGKAEIKAKVRLSVCKGLEECVTWVEDLKWTIDAREPGE